jgi:hypothetical protein
MKNCVSNNFGIQFAQQLDDPFEGRSLIYNAADYEYHYGVEVEDGQITGPAEDPAVISYLFEGSNEAYVLNGNYGNFAKALNTKQIWIADLQKMAA